MDQICCQQEREREREREVSLGREIPKEMKLPSRTPKKMRGATTDIRSNAMTGMRNLADRDLGFMPPLLGGIFPDSMTMHRCNVRRGLIGKLKCKCPH